MVADQFGVRPHLLVNEGAQDAHWDEARKLWRVTTTKGQVLEAEILVAALGQLNRPQWPKIEGLEDFAGARMHAAAWDHDVDLAGKRVGVIGSAASAVQLIPEVTKIAGRLSVFQRTPNYVLPRLDQPVTQADKALLMSAPDMAMRLAGMQRDSIFEGSDNYFWQVFQWTPEGRAAYEEQARLHLEAQVPDPALREKLTPTYPIGCKRILFCDDFYPALQKPNVTLVTDPIVRVTPQSIVTQDGFEHELDVLVCATGFETTGWKWSLDIVGAGGVKLHDVWADAPEVYLGVMSAGFPNLFFMYGPHTNLGHNSIIAMLEAQAEYIGAAVGEMAQRGVSAIAPTANAQAHFMAALDRDLTRTVWADPACASWYKNAAGRITQNWGSNVTAYRAALAALQWDDFAVSE
jgi:cation diffusion facilitator CzcD-associated flavoprotein CzcO